MNKIGKKSAVIALLIVVAAIVFLIIRDRQKSVPGNIFKSATEECDKTGYGYKGMCYGNLAVLRNDKSLCDKITKSESFNKKRCEDYYDEKVKK